MLVGDGIGFEVMVEVFWFIDWFLLNCDLLFYVEEVFVGGCFIDVDGVFVIDVIMEKVMVVDVVLLGVVGGLKWVDVDFVICLEVGLFCLCKDMELFVNLWFVICFEVFMDVFLFKLEVVGGFDIMIVCELIGGVYFGELWGIMDLLDG